MKDIRCIFGLHKWCKGRTYWGLGNLIAYTNFQCLRCFAGMQMNSMGLMTN